ncbi:hypothetical protein [Anaerorhabdus sp.]|uniref:hypothetical protein n=1 Tax=Anaerorhabdus sp. TaxID=1872524 RepID=UPI002FCC1DD1
MTKKKSKINGYLLIVILAMAVVVTLLFGFNIVSVGLKKGAGAGTTVEVDSGSTMKNDQYTIGNNPTDFSKETFKKLTKALKDNVPEDIATAVVENFIADFYTWTNKDGNYEVGGTQYIWSSKYVSFMEQQRYGFYKDLDLYISQYGRENLLEVDTITASAIKIDGDYEFNGSTYPQYYVTAEWTYKATDKIDTSEFMDMGYFIVANHDGRYEIVEFYGAY